MNYEGGSIWRRWDLHFHTPKSHDYNDKSLTASALVDALLNARVSVVGVTDHHTVDINWILQMRTAAAGRLTILPGIELTSNLGGKDAVHFIGLFPEDADLEFLAAEIASKTDISKKRQEGVADEHLYVDFTTAAKVIRDAGGLVTIHGHGKANSIEGIANNPVFKQQLKEDLLREYVDILEIGNAERRLDYQQIVFPSIGFERPLVVGSDNHDAKVYSERTPCWVKADPTFRGLRMALREPWTRFHLGDRPPDLERIEKNKTKYIKSVSFSKKPEMPAGEQWLDGKLVLNTGLVAVIGNKGSGKSALSDCLGLLGSCRTSASFSFLNDKGFLDPKSGRAQHVAATLEWHNGEQRTRALNESVKNDEVERVTYLPQHHVETVCNELSTPGGGGFERELKEVIFSHVSTADRLGKRSLDDLLQFRTQELRKTANSLDTRLRELGVKRADLEAKLDPSVRSLLQNRIEQRKKEIEAHEAAKPVEVKPPGLDPAAAAALSGGLEAITKLKQARDAASQAVRTEDETATAAQLRAARAQKLLDKLTNLESDLKQLISDLDPEATELGLTPTNLVTYEIKQSVVEGIRT